MLKNVAGQKVGGQVVNAADGSPFTGAVTVYVTGDAGVQAAGSVGSGACVHEGNGFHTYAPAQAETNYDHIAFTFIGTGAVPATVQVYTDQAYTMAAATFTLLDIVGSTVNAIPTANQNAEALLTRDWTEVAGEAPRSVLNALRILRNKMSTTTTPGSVEVFKEDDSTSAWTQPLTTDASAEPITEVG